MGWGAGEQRQLPAPASRCWVQTTCDPALANYVFIPTQRTNLLFPKSHITRGYTEIKWLFSYCCSESPGSAQKFSTQTRSGKTFFKTQNSATGLSSPIPTPPPLIPGRQTYFWLWTAAAAELRGLQGRLEKHFFHSKSCTGARGTGELRHGARELLVYMGNVGLGDVMSSRATPAQQLHRHQGQPGSFEAHKKQDERETCFLSQEHSDTSKPGLSPQ